MFTGVPSNCHHPYLKNNGTLEAAEHIANHESPRTTKLYDRRQDEISLDEVERIAI
jgi:integrase/recombinase XerD